MTKKVLLLVLALALAATQAQAYYASSQPVTTDCPKECGKDKDNMECPNNLCCSAGGLCGLGSAYCGAGCQSGACSESRRCGWHNKNATCPNNQCCSWDGYCGLGDWFCRNNKCQSGPCHYDVKCGKQPDGTQEPECANNFCCNKYGRCGLGAKYCNSDAGCQSGACYDDSITMGERKKCANKEGGNNGKSCINKQGCTRP